MRSAVLLKHDVQFQIRHGFYYVYLFLTVLYILLLRLVLPPEVSQFVAPILIFSDPGVMGFFFIGGIVLLEKEQNIQAGLFITPLQVHEYLMAKVLSLTALAVGTSLLILLVSFGGRFQLLPAIIGITLTSLFFTLLGIAVAVRARSLNHYLIGSMAFSFFFFPMLEYLGLLTSPLFYLLPAQGSLLLLVGSFGGLSRGQWWYAVGILIIWIAIAYLWALRWFYRYIIARMGGGGQ